MKSDLHHLFTCESGCNSSRGNKNYYDFKHYNPDADMETLRKECGFGEGNLFEPESGKGAVTRATLYFLLRYPRKVRELKTDDLNLLMTWHADFPPDDYELHRNAEIHKIQGNRNPFIDFYEESKKLNMSLAIRS